MKTRSAILAAVFLASLPAAALGETDEERQACIGDAFRVCSSAIPDRHGVFLCLLQNRAKLSAACRNVLASHSRPPAAMRAYARE